MVLRSPKSFFTRTNKLLLGVIQIQPKLSRAFCDGMHERFIKMPSIMTAKVLSSPSYQQNRTPSLGTILMLNLFHAQTGTIDKWLKKEGDVFDSRESLCEVTLSEEDVRIAIDAHRSGVIAEILVEAGHSIAVGEPIAMFVDNMDEYMEHVENIRLASGEAEMMEEMKPANNDALTQLNSKTLLRQIRNMMQKGDIESDTEFAKELLSLARKGQEDLLSVFEASCDGDKFSAETFDKKFFLENAVDIVKESLEIKKSAH